MITGERALRRADAAHVLCASLVHASHDLVITPSVCGEEVSEAGKLSSLPDDTQLGSGGAESSLGSFCTHFNSFTPLYPINVSLLVPETA